MANIKIYFQTEIAQVSLVGMRRVLPSASVKNRGPTYLLLSLLRRPLEG